MPVKTDQITVSSKGKKDVIDITGEIRSLIGKNTIDDGIVVVFVPGSTGAITTIEYEPGLKKDIDIFLDKIAPYNAKYHHHDTWNDDNGSSHIQASLIGPSLTVPIVNGDLALGTWQQVVLIDCDTRARKRNIVVQFVY
ncbi:secondary thiamine-phosphate synthase enzyme YjbQ [Spirochaetota bacterium]